MVGDGQCCNLYFAAIGMWGYTPVRITGVLVSTSAVVQCDPVHLKLCSAGAFVKLT